MNDQELIEQLRRLPIVPVPDELKIRARRAALTAVAAPPELVFPLPRWANVCLLVFVVAVSLVELGWSSTRAAAARRFDVAAGVTSNASTPEPLAQRSRSAPDDAQG